MKKGTEPLSKEKMANAPLIITKHSSAYWRVTFDNPPINLLDPDMINGLSELMNQLETDKDVRVVVFDSADEDYFISHFDVLRVEEFNNIKTKSGLSAWIDIAVRLYNCPVISIASVRGRARGNGAEFLVACDLRFASKEKAILGQMEVGVGAIPGGGALERLPALVGRSRTLEIIIGADDFNAETAERYGWINRAIPDSELDDYVDAFATRIGTFDKEIIAETKSLINQRSGGIVAEDTTASMAAFFKAASRPETQAKFGKLFEWGLQQPSDLELSFGSYLDKL